MELPLFSKLVRCYVRPERGVVINEVATNHGDLVPKWPAVPRRGRGGMDALVQARGVEKANHGPTTSVIERAHATLQLGRLRAGWTKSDNGRCVYGTRAMALLRPVQK